MAFMRRQNGVVESTAADFQNFNNAKRQLVDSSIGQCENYQYTENVKTSPNLYDYKQSKKVEFIDFEDASIENSENETSIDRQTVNELSNAIDVLNAQTVNKSRGISEHEYIPIRCRWIDELYERFKLENIFFKKKEYQIDWVSIRYRSLLECVLSLSRINIIEWKDLAELTNAFTFLMSSEQFKDLPITYPYRKEIVLLRDKLKAFCMETRGEECIKFRLKLDTKKELLFQRFALAQHFQKLTFNQVQQDFKNEQFKANQKRVETQRKEPERKAWQVRFGDLKAKRDS
jgi:hypothetical protein